MNCRLAFVVVMSNLMAAYALYGQQQTKVVDFGKNADITVITASEKYIAVKVNHSSSPGVAYLFDKSGNKLLEKEEGALPISQVEASDALDFFITIEPSLDDAEGLPGQTGGRIQAFKVAGGSLVWSTRAHAEGYRLSPDGMSLMNYGEGGPSPIVNMKDGSIVTLAQRTEGEGCDWLDSVRVAIAIQEVKPDPEAQQYFQDLSKRRRDRAAAQDSLIHLRLRCSLDLDAGKISKMEFENKTAKLNQLIDELRKQERDEEKTTQHEHKHATALAATRMCIYNIETGQIELQKDIYAPNGDPIILNAGPVAVGIVNVDRATKSIYLYANKGNLGTQNQNTRCLVKLDRSLNVESVVLVGGLTKLTVGDKIYFLAGGKYLVNNGTLQLLQNNSIQTESGNIALNPRSTNLLQVYVPGLSIEKNGSLLQFSVSKEVKK